MIYISTISWIDWMRLTIYLKINKIFHLKSSLNNYFEYSYILLAARQLWWTTIKSYKLNNFGISSPLFSSKPLQWLNPSKRWCILWLMLLYLRLVICHSLEFTLLRVPANAYMTILRGARAFWKGILKANKVYTTHQQLHQKLGR